MSKYAVTAGVQDSPVKTVLYGPEGIGKSTFASHFPNPVFIDTEGGTKRLNVARLPQPTSWAMLLDEVAEVRKGSIPCGTLVIDTADWAERLCIQAVCAKAKVNGIEDFGYGKGYTYVKEEFGKLLDALEEVLQAGHNVVVLAHAAITKFEQPDAVGNYDRWSMKTSKQVAPLLREWCDMLLFANYKTVVEKVGDGKNAKSKASGGRRVLYTAHHPCWDAKNRFDLPEEVPFDYASIAACIPGSSAQKAPSQRELAAKQTEGVRSLIKNRKLSVIFLYYGRWQYDALGSAGDPGGFLRLFLRIRDRIFLPESDPPEKPRRGRRFLCRPGAGHGGAIR